MSFRLEFREQAQRQIKKIARQNPQLARSISKKILWLVHNMETICHEQMKGHQEYSLHSGQYRILYTIEWADHRVIIEDIDKHDHAYRRLRGR